MSLIEEALRRQQDESKSAAASAAPPPPPPSSPKEEGPGEELPQPPPPEQGEGEEGGQAPQGKPRNWLMLVGIVALVLALAGAVVWLVFSGLRQWGGERKKKPATEAQAEAGKAEEKPRAAGTNAAGLQEEPVAVRPTPMISTQAVDFTTGPDVRPIATPETGAVGTAVAVATGGSGGQAAPELVPPPKAPVVWPRLHLSGVSAMRGRSAAILNGKIIGEGEKIEGVTLRRVVRGGVELEYEGEKRFLEVNETIQ